MEKREIRCYGRFFCIKDYAPDFEHYGIDCRVGSEYVVMRYTDNGQLEIRKCDSGSSVEISEGDLKKHFLVSVYEDGTLGEVASQLVRYRETHKRRDGVINICSGQVEQDDCNYTERDDNLRRLCWKQDERHACSLCVETECE